MGQRYPVGAAGIWEMDIPTLAYAADRARERGDRDAALVLIEAIFKLFDRSAGGSSPESDTGCDLLKDFGS